MDESVVKHLEQRNETADSLRRARALVDRPEKWAKGGPGNRKTTRCLGWAFADALGLSWEPATVTHPATILFLRANEALIPKHARSYSKKDIGILCAINNWPAHSHRTILAAFDLAIELAEREQGRGF